MLVASFFLLFLSLALFCIFLTIAMRLENQTSANVLQGLGYLMLIPLITLMVYCWTHSDRSLHWFVMVVILIVLVVGFWTWHHLLEGHSPLPHRAHEERPRIEYTDHVEGGSSHH